MSKLRQFQKINFMSTSQKNTYDKFAKIDHLDADFTPSLLIQTMYHNTTVIGLMDQAYFVPRQQIIRWVNQCLNLNIQAIEDLGTGATYCQLLDYGFGQRVPMQKVNWKAKFDYEFIGNFKVFQNTLEKLGIVRKIEIEKLAKAKYQDNLELIQWLKRYIQLNGTAPTNYHPEERRSNAQLYLISQEKKILGNSFKTNVSVLNNSSVLLNQSVCSTTSKPRQSLKPRSITNKENEYSSSNKQISVQSKLSEQMNQIKKVLMSNDDSDTKVNEIQTIVYGPQKQSTQQYQATSNLMDIQAVSEDEEMVF